MQIPEPDDIESEFHVLDEDYQQPDFYGGAFEGSHVYADLIIFHLYSIIPADGDSLRIETRHHFAGQVVEHRQTSRPLDRTRTVKGSDRSLEEYCREHHFDSPRDDLAAILTAVEDSDEYGYW